MTDVSKDFGKHQVLKQLNLIVPEHSIFAFLGNNGEGKSTAIRLIVGLLQADHGSIQVLGHDIRLQRQRILSMLGCIVDAPSAYPNLTAREFLSIACIVKGLAQKEVERVLELVKLRTDKKRLIQQFSLGMKQRLAIAHALLGQPKLLILDEPTNGLDPEGIQDIRQLLRSLPETARCSVFVSSHQLAEVEKMATHLALLKDGKIQFQTEIASLLAQQTGNLTLTICDADKAMQVLSKLGYQLSKTNQQQLQVIQLPHERAEHVNGSLVRAGILLYQSVFQQASLEQWFHQSTTEQAA